VARILVVDDESSIRFLMRLALEMDAHQVDEAPNGLVAIEAVEGGSAPDLVATDFMMPLMNGAELIERIRANPATAEVPVILVSASPGSERRTGADAFFRKPFDPAELARCGAAARRRPAVNRLSTGATGLDVVLGGGLPAGSLVIVAGPPGSGKTILAQQMCFANATSERRALYYTTWSEPHDKLIRHLEPFSFFDAHALGERVEFLHLAELMSSDAGSLDAVSEEILRRSFETRPAIVVIDSSKALHDVVEAGALRRAIYDLASRVAHSDAVLILVGEYSAEETRMQPEFAVADAILQLENEARGPVDRRWLRVLKLRGGEMSSGRHSFRITANGVEVFPRLESALPKHTSTQAGRAAFGDARLDAAIGGGIPRGDSTLLVGPSGVGKTLLGLAFIAAGLEHGERCLHVSFQETETQVREKAAAAGWDWSSISEDRLVIRQVPPVELDLDQVASLILAELERGGIKRVLVDSLAELSFAARDTERLPAYVWALGGFVRAAGGTSIFTNEIAALGESGGLAGLSFLFNNVFFLRYVEVQSELARGLSILKMRESDHDKGLLRFTIDRHGIAFGDKIDDVSGLLGWSALSAGAGEPTG
jgi:circadian clock protein KaiC